MNSSEQNPSSVFDVIVVGAGGSGLASALEAAQHGLSVLIIEKAPQPGGATAWSVGAFTTSSSPHQKKAGVVDSCDQHFADMDLVNANAKRADNMQLRRLLVDKAPDTLQWLMDLGVEFMGPHAESPHTKPRMHNAVPGGVAMVYYLVKHCKKAGVQIACNTKLHDLLFEDGQVCGVQVLNSHQHIQKIYAKRAVILASGDFSGSREMRERFFDPAVVNAAPVVSINTGDGLLVAEKYGAQIINGDYAAFYIPRMRFVPQENAGWLSRLPPTKTIAQLMQWAMKYLPPAIIRPFMMKMVTTVLGPEPALFKAGAALINMAGTLIDVDFKSPARHLALDQHNKGYIVFDQKLAQQFQAWPHFISTAPGIAYAYLKDYEHSRPDIFHRADTIDQLAKTIDIDLTQLQNTLRQHNQKNPACGSIEQGPFYALGPVRGYITITEGGLNVNEQLQVIGKNQKPIPHLYACGSAGQGGVLLDGHGHHLSWAFVSGRHAAQQVLQETAVY